MSKHTATPWHVVDNGHYLEIVVPHADEPGVVNQYCPNVVSVITYAHASDAAFIVRAVNSHYALVAALRDIAKDAEASAENGDAEGALCALGDIARAARRALAAAEA